jgi:hypothetical protein
MLSRRVSKVKESGKKDSKLFETSLPPSIIEYMALLQILRAKTISKPESKRTACVVG